MKTNKHLITVYEHQRLKLGFFGEGDDRFEFKSRHLAALEQHYGNGELNYYKLINKGVQFNQYVGVLKVGDLTIEVLPKADRNNDASVERKAHWRDLLIGMLKAVGVFNVQAPSSASLNTKSHFVLDLYFELFIKEVEYLLNMGLVKQYAKTEGQSLALKGALQFGQHVSKNVVHKERFYVRYSEYSHQQPLNQILFKTLKLIQRINTNTSLQSRIGALLLHFPELSDIKVSDALFEKIKYNRKTTVYQNAIEISRLLLLNYHPDVSAGRNDVLAIMFDMNALWERFVYTSLRKHLGNSYYISAQTSKRFWQSDEDEKATSTMRPDIVVSKVANGENDTYTVVLDTKWKNIDTSNPSPDDLRQMYVYHEYFDAKKVALIYPGDSPPIISGNYLNTSNDTVSNKICGVVRVGTEKKINGWQSNIAHQLTKFIQLSSSNQ